MMPLGPCDDHIDRSAPTARAHEPIAPIKNASPSAIFPGHLGGIGLDLVATTPAPHDQPHAGCGGVAQRHRRAGFGLHLRHRSRVSAQRAAFAKTAPRLYELGHEFRLPQKRDPSHVQLVPNNVDRLPAVNPR
jgi:hypothetical protein